MLDGGIAPRPERNCGACPKPSGGASRCQDRFPRLL